jgi:hypothetical protein
MMPSQRVTSEEGLENSPNRLPHDLLNLLDLAISSKSIRLVCHPNKQSQGLVERFSFWVGFRTDLPPGGCWMAMGSCFRNGGYCRHSLRAGNYWNREQGQLALATLDGNLQVFRSKSSRIAVRLTETKSRSGYPDCFFRGRNCPCRLRKGQLAKFSRDRKPPPGAWRR